MRRSAALVSLTVLAVLSVSLALDPIVHIGQDAYASALVATFAGVISGVPLALLIDRYRQLQEEKARRAEDAVVEDRRAAVEASRVNDVLGLIKGELKACLAALAVRSSTPWEVRPPFMSSGVWQPMTASGEIRGINPTVLGRIATAYHLVNATSDLEATVFRLSLDPMFRTIQWSSVEAAGGGPSPLSVARNEMSTIDGATLQAVQEAVTAINAALASPV